MKKKILVCSLAAIMITNISVVSYGKTVDGMKQEQKENNQKINDLNNKKSNLEGEKTKIQSDIEDLSSKILAQSKIVNEKNSVVEEYEKKIQDIKDQIKSLEENINKLQDNIITLEMDKTKKEEVLGKRLRGIYKSDMYGNIFSFLLESESIGDFISRIDGLGRIVKNDQTLLKEVEYAQNDLELSENKLNEERILMNEQVESLNSSKETLVQEKQKYEDALKELKSIENEKITKKNNLSSEERKLHDQILALEESNDELQKDIEGFLNSVNNGSNGSQTQGGSFIRPVSDVITSNFGYRTHPVTGEQKLHTGTDFGSPYGTPVKASKNGTVVLSGTYGGYGNTVIIDHGGGIQTLYAHNSSLLVKSGQTVKQGDIISKVGSTGVSTGPHLHFEVRVNGTPQNPMNYIK
ncbi:MULTISPECIES: murein hydrolase activator EnvC family protein [Clostridium]|uniref:Murein DD-endopeptidase MepM and murein hydrolase activator NlpD, contain LysM domain n=1 Tax=Clostridium cadaveris TaxID=1529 RepID=A0A1I2MWZ4_9CLOT|nr:peptidoglycan DD-metalloendopeptidase family protein [Clostridium cadaveris]MDU4953231.1 peptidoglycan DD-metalloendopeptidase family protein [Clostridium sp.]MDM8312731.1 peptidoglycan DD-metalloendopeptidase family protein [Clostridium cadaveris]MDY4947873.1 peptidoglycan DD-metalloendopeptidase family protein [Clostridium cadaveris]NME65415.1 peptidoglycan DD-metalloendopeptidase family protein [Clostridium cadaveris]NWK11775.1 peptidoglycan DD-metalloendopeptidase family protein [Clostr